MSFRKAMPPSVRNQEPRLARIKKSPLLLLLSCVIACRAQGRIDGPLDERWRWDRGEEAEEILQRIGSDDAPRPPFAVVGVTGLGLRTIVLPQGTTWDVRLPANVLPTIVSDTVLFTAEGNLYALELDSGRQKFRLPVGDRRLEGAGYDGKFFVLLLVDEHDARPDEIWTLNDQGQQIGRIASKKRLGTPAARSGIGLVPFDYQYIAGFDLASGKLIGRLLYRDNLHSVTSDKRGVLLWGRGVTAFDSALPKQAESYSLRMPELDFPGSPQWPVDGSKPRPARSRPINVLAYPSVQAGSLTFSHNSFFTTYYQIVLAQDVKSQNLRWVTHLPRSIVGATAAENHILVCLQDGTIVALDMKSGGQVNVASLNARLMACSVSSYNAPPSSERRPSLREQIYQTVTQTGTDMAEVHVLLLDRLARLPGAETTGALLRIAQNPMVSSELSRYAGHLLSQSEAGGDEMVRALVSNQQEREARIKEASEAAQQDETAQTPADEVFDKEAERAQRPPPVAEIAQALERLKPPGAAGALAYYLDDPSLTSSELKTLINALTAFNSSSINDQVWHFVMNYKNTGGDDELLDALITAIKFLIVHLDEAQRRELSLTLDESLTYPDLRRRIAPLFTTESTPADAGNGQKVPESAEDHSNHRESRAPLVGRGRPNSASIP